jgi:MoaA/NifB/PqqE/SkfB family radical SAM enzyme
MTRAVWLRTLAELAALDYSGWFAFHNYNEPLADPRILSLVREARRALARAKLTIYTNGDYLTARLLDDLCDAGISEVKVTLYPTADCVADEPMLSRAVSFLDHLGLTVASHAEHYRRTELHAHTGHCLVRVAVPRVTRFSSRAGYLPLGLLAHPTRALRKEPCLLPCSSAAIDWKGNLKLCCQIYDVTLDQYKPYNMGNIESRSLPDLWFSDRFEQLRARLALARFGADLAACRWCDFRVAPGDR